MRWLHDREEFNSKRDALSHPPIPEATMFQNAYAYEEPVQVHGWQWSYTFNRWSALVTFKDGWHGFTYPKPVSVN